jgi:hypothetical protein
MMIWSQAYEKHLQRGKNQRSPLYGALHHLAANGQRTERDAELLLKVLTAFCQGRSVLALRGDCSQNQSINCRYRSQIQCWMHQSYRTAPLESVLVVDCGIAVREVQEVRDTLDSVVNLSAGEQAWTA